jgi:predicted dehydrogenase
VPSNQKNFAYFEYEDDNGNFWNVRGESGGALTAVDGHTTDYANPPFGKQSKRRHVRYVELTHPETFRKARGIVYTPAAYAAISAGDSINVTLAGLATAEAFLVSAKIPERIPVPSTPRQLTEATGA